MPEKTVLTNIKSVISGVQDHLRKVLSDDSYRKEVGVQSAVKALQKHPDMMLRPISSLTYLSEGFRHGLYRAALLAAESAEVLETAVRKYSETTGKPLLRALDDIRDVATSAAIALSPRYRPPQTLVEKVIFGAGAAIPYTVEYILANRVVRLPALAMALVDAANTYPVEPELTPQAFVSGLITGAGLAKVARIPQLSRRVLAGAGVGAAGQAVISPTPEAIATGAVFGGAVSIPRARTGPEARLIVERGKGPSALELQVSSPSQGGLAAYEILRPILQDLRIASRTISRIRKPWEEQALDAIQGLSPKENEQVIKWLHDPNYSLSNLPQGSPKQVRAYVMIRQLLDDIYSKIHATAKLHTEAAGVKPEDIAPYLPGYYPRETKGLWRIYQIVSGVKVPLMPRHIARSFDEAKEIVNKTARLMGRDIEVVIEPYGTFNPVDPKFYSTYYFSHLKERKLPEMDLPRDFHALFDYIAEAAKFIALAPIKPRIAKALADIEKRYPQSAVSAAAKRYFNAVYGYDGPFTAMVNDLMERYFGGRVRIQAVLAAIRAVELLMKLGFNPGAAMVNATQIPINILPVLGPKYTLIGIREAFNYWSTGRWAQLIDKYGIIDMDSKAQGLTIAEAMRIGLAASTTERLQHGLVWAISKGLWMFSKVEEAGRLTAFLGAFRRALDMGFNRTTAARIAEEVMVRTMFDMSRADAAVLANNPWFTTMFQFRTYAMKQLEFMFGLAKGSKSVVRFDPAHVELGRFLLAVGLTTGVAGLPGAELFDWLVRFLSGYSMLDWLRRSYPWASAGIPGLIGIDISLQAGYGDWFTLEFMSNPQRAVTSNLLGSPIMQDLMVIIKYIHSNFSGDLGDKVQARRQMIQKINPMVRRFYELFVDYGKRTGAIHDYKGRIIVDDLSVYEKFAYFLGLTPQRVAKARRIFLEQQEAISKARNVRQGYYQAIAELVLQGKYRQAAYMWFQAIDSGVRLDINSLERRMREMSVPRYQYFLDHYKNYIYQTMTTGGTNLTLEDFIQLMSGEEEQ